MPSFQNRRRVRHSAADMFALVADVERYPEFVPLCRALRVLRRVPGEGGTEVVVAAMEVGYRAIRETFTSRITLDPAGSRILVEYVDGPFSRLENRWTFADAAEAPCASDVEFYIAYEFRSRALGLLMGTMFDVAFRKFAAAFEARADAMAGAARAEGG